MKQASKRGRATDTRQAAEQFKGRRSGAGDRQSSMSDGAAAAAGWSRCEQSSMQRAGQRHAA